MRKLIATTMTVLAVVALAALVPSSAQAGVKKLARAECKVERATDTREFKARYGGMGKKAMKRCIKAERAEAKRDCKEDRRTETNEFIGEYGGTDRKALKRCMRDELR